MDAELEASTRAELERLELLLLNPAVRRNREQVSGLLAQDFVEFGSSGRVWTREETLELLATETYAPPAVEDLECRMIAADAALVTYRAVRTRCDGSAEDYAAKLNLDQDFWKLANAFPPGNAHELTEIDSKRLPYNSCRRKRSSFSRHRQLVHSRQQTRRIATPSVTRMASTLAYEANQ